MKLIKATVFALGTSLLVAADAIAATKAASPAPARKATGWAARAEQMALAMLPQDKFNEAAGFFGPVSKKYLPTFQKFQREYLAAREKLPVLRKYMPDAEAALADAKAMKVPARYEAKKAEYVKMLEGFMGAFRWSLKFANGSK